jgi:tetratricopeptide (TPR) repeat protein
MAVDKNKIIAEATKLVQKGAFDKAIKTYERILAEDPKDVRIVLKIGELQQKLRDDKGAAESFKRVADIYTDQGFFLKAVAVYKQATKLDPDDLRVNEKLAALNQQLGLLSDAMSQLQLVAQAYELQRTTSPPRSSSASSTPAPASRPRRSSASNAPRSTSRRTAGPTSGSRWRSGSRRSAPRTSGSRGSWPTSTSPRGTPSAPSPSSSSASRPTPRTSRR